MYKSIVRFILLLVTFIFLTSCNENKNLDFLPESCQTYNNFMYLISDDFYYVLQNNGIEITKNNFADSLNKVRLLEIKEESLTSEIDLNGIQCFPYLNQLELEGKGIKDISPLIDLKRIETLIINNTRIFDLEPLTNMTKLKNLTITNTKTLESLSGIENFKRLEYVDLSNNGLIDVKQLGSLNRLTEIVLNNNKISDITELKSLPQLKKLHVEQNKIDFNKTSEFEGFKSLQELYIKTNNICRTEALSTLENLEFLDISDNNLGNRFNDLSCSLEKPDFSFIKEIPSLRVLYARSNGLNSLETIQDVNIKHITELDFSNNEITTIEPLVLNESLLEGNLKILSLNHNEIKDVYGINALKTLTSLTLNNNQIGINGDLIEPVYALENLVNLDLSHNEISELPSLIEGDVIKLPKIDTLNVSFNNLTEINKLTEHDNLKNIILNNNQIITIKDSFVNMKNLEKIIWFDTETIDTELNSISSIVNSFNNVSKLTFFEEGVLTFDFPTNNLVIKDSFNSLKQFIGIYLDSFNIAGIDEDSFHLDNVFSISISDNKLTDINWINNLPNLRILTASNNHIQIESDVIEENSIIELDLSNNDIESVTFLDAFKDIEKINLENNMISLGYDSYISYEELNILSNFTNLKDLNLAKNDITVLNGIYNLSNLETLDLSGNNLIEINGLVNLPKLTNLNIDYNYLITYVNGLSNLGLTSLPLEQLTSDNIIITSLSLKDNKFTELILSNKTIENNDFEFIKNLDYKTDFYLDRTNISSLESLSNLINLELLVANNNQIIDITPLQDLINMQILILDSNDISNITPLENLTNLKYLSLRNNFISSIQTNSSKSVFDEMKDLEYLELGENNFTSLVGLNNLAKLEYLSIPLSVNSFNNTLNGLNSLEEFTNFYSNTYHITNNNLIIMNSFNSENFKYLIFL